MAQATAEMKETKPASPSKPNVLDELGLRAKPEDNSKPSELQSDEKKSDEKPPEVNNETKTEVQPSASKKEEAEADKAKLEKQLKDTRDAFTQERQVNKTLQAQMKTLEQQLTVLGKKIDGTYDEEKDGHKPPSLDDVKQAERVATSHFAAVDRYGKDYVMQTIWADDAPFRQFDHDPAVQARVFGSPTPILEAIKVVKEAESQAKYGKDPDAMRKAIEQEVRATVEKEVRQKLMKEFGKGTDDEIKGLGNVRQVPDAKTETPKRLDFEGLFPGFQKTAG